MITLEEASSHIAGQIAALNPRPTPIGECLGLVLAESVVTAEFSPPFDNSAMDGFAVRSADLAGESGSFEIVASIAAGDDPDVVVGPGQAARIMTGAVLPAGADAVVMVERSTVESPDRVTLEGPIESGTSIRRSGEDLRPGDSVLAAGVVLGPAQMGVAVTVGRADLNVVPKPRVGVFSTGDELVQPGESLARGQIRDSNRPTVAALVAQHGGEPVDLGWIPDDPDQIRACLLDAAERCDAVVTSGGVSMGDHDHVRYVLDEIGETRWMQVAIKPAKPLAFGLVGGTPVFGLPGNPVSVVVSFTLFVAPSLRTMAGHTMVSPDPLTAVAGVDLTRRPDGKTHFARVEMERGDDGLEVRPSGGQGSHQLGVLARSNALAVLPDGNGILKGERVQVIALADYRWLGQPAPSVQP